jgi:hypothetical protein
MKQYLELLVLLLFTFAFFAVGFDDIVTTTVSNTQTTINMPVRTSAQRQDISAMVSATMRTTTVAVSSIKETVVVTMSSNATAKNANVNKRRTSNSRYVCVVGGLHVHDDSDIYCTIGLG